MANKKILIDIKVTDAQASTNIKKTKEAVEGLAQATDNLGVRTSKNNANSGLNNTILQETGRLASDAAYGFQGMANNLGQLVSLFQIAAKNSGGWGAALKDVGKSLSGVGGILIAVQLLISFLPRISAGLSKWINQTTALDEALKKSTKSFTEQISNLNVYVKKLNDTNTSEEERKNIIKNVNEEYEGLNLKLDENNNLTETSNDNLTIYIELIKQRAEMQAILDVIREKSAERTSIENSSLSESTDWWTGLVALFKSAGTPLEVVSNATREASNRSAQLSQDILKLIESLKIVAPNALEAGKQLKKAFVAGDLDFDNEIVNSMARVSSSLAFNEELKIKIQSESQKKLARIRQQDFADRQQKRVDAIKNDEDRAKAQIAVDASIAESQASLNAYLIQIDKETERRKNARNLADQEKAYALLEKLQGIELQSRLKFDIAMEDMDLNRIEKQRDLNELATKNKIDLLNRELSHAESVGNSTIAIQEKINNVNAESNRASIELDKAEFEVKKQHLMDLGSAVVEFAGESSNAGKAASIAMAIINTEEAITKALGLPFPFNFVVASAVGLKGASSISKILSTKIPGKEPSNSGASGGETVSAPAFNIVGTSETSQLAQAVGGREDSVVRAYVVGSEITSQQELDRKITNTAGL